MPNYFAQTKNKFFDIIEATLNKKLDQISLEWYNSKALSIVVCSKGYPEKFEKDKEINNLDKVILENDEFIFHAGTKIYKSKIFSNGGRVLNFVANKKSFKESKNSAIDLIRKIKWESGFYRKDIGFKVIDE